MRDTIISFKAQPESVDTTNRVLRNVILAQAGAAKGHNMSIEQRFINDIVAQAQGDVLSNFGHNWDNMGLQLGRVKAVHTEGSKAMGDLHIYSNADNSPRFPNMGTWVMQQATEDPESLMLSIRFKPSHFYQYDDNGAEVKLRRDFWGDYIPQFVDREIFVGLEKLVSVDVVDSGALTDSMFSQPAEGQGFLSRFWAFMTGKMTDKEFEMAAENTTRGPEDEETDLYLAEKKDGGTNDGGYIWVGDKQFKAEDVTAMLSEITALKSGDGEMRSKIELLAQKVAQLEAENTELKAEPAAELTTAEAGNVSMKTATDPELAAFGASLRRSGRRR